MIFAADAMRLEPDYRLEIWRNNNLYKDPAHLERRLDALGRAGLK